MVDDEIPMNAGCLRPIRIVIPEGSMLSPRYPAAVVAGNVETSQAVTDTLFGALHALGSAQGTMNNLTFGDARYQYYETICSGAPAGPGFDGASAVHTHMTNSRLTDPEVLESRFPVGAGGFPHPARLGRQGPLERRRRHAAQAALPPADGPGAADRASPRADFRHGRRRGGRTRPQFRRRNGGAVEALEGCAQTVLEAGEAIVIVTPTGGGWGKG